MAFSKEIKCFEPFSFGPLRGPWAVTKFVYEPMKREQKKRKLCALRIR